MELVLMNNGKPDENSREFYLVWTDGFDATESVKFRAKKLDKGFELELVGGTVTMLFNSAKNKIVVE